jgi:hypothetical protein
MTTIDHDQATTEIGRFCPECGQPGGDSNFCSRCGHNMGYAADRSPADTTLQRPNANNRKSRRRVGFIIAGAVVGLVAAAVATIVLFNTHSSKASAASTPVPSASANYRRQLTKVLTPVITANQTVSSSLSAMSGSKHATHAAKTSTAEALAALDGARGGLRVLSVPGADATLSGQVQQALTADNGYLESVSSTLTTPTGTGAGQLQTLATGAQSALVTLDPVVSGASTSISGTGNLISWAHGADKANRAAPAQPQTVAPNSATVAPATTPPSTSTAPSAPPGLTACDQNISVNAATTSCQFADSVFAGYASIDQANGGPVSTDVTATSAATGGTYTDDCQYNASTQIVLCSHGTDLIQFPEWAAEVYDG